MKFSKLLLLAYSMTTIDAEGCPKTALDYPVTELLGTFQSTVG